MTDILERFSPATREWFRGAFAAPTLAQLGAWEAISEGDDALVVAPTGSGKTLASFLWSIDPLASGPPPEVKEHRTRVLYISPLKALGVDVERNLRSPARRHHPDGPAARHRAHPSVTRRRAVGRHPVRRPARSCSAPRPTSSSRRPSRST